MWSYPDPRAAVGDALRLSRAMTLKAAVADLPLGGGKGVIMASADAVGSPGPRRAALLDFADAVQSLQGRYVTAEDVGTSSRDMSVIAQRTAHVAGLARARGGSGDPSPATAHGVHAALQATCERAFGDGTLAGRSICVIGLGHVGSRVAKRCAQAGASLVVADVDERKRAIAERLGARWTTPGRALSAAVDVVVPCALGGLLNDTTVPRLRCRAIVGAANNQLAREAVAVRLAQRDILWAPDFVANAGGVINISCEQGGYDATIARRRVRGIADTLREIFDRAEAEGSTPLAAALALARSRLTPRAQLRGSDTAEPGGTLDAGRQPTLVGELVKMGGEGDAGRRAKLRGDIAPGGVEHLRNRARPVIERDEEPALAVQTVGDVLMKLGVGIGHGWTVPRAQDGEIALSQPAQALQVAGQRAGIGRDEHAALAEHRISGEARPAGDEGEVIRRVARGGERLQRPELVAVGERHVNPAAGRRQGRIGKCGADRRHRLRVIMMVVGERDAAQTPAALELGDERLDVHVKCRPGVDQPARIVADDPGIGPGEGERPGIAGPQPDDSEVAKVDPGHCLNSQP